MNSLAMQRLIAELRQSGIADEAVLAAIGAVDRERFVSAPFAAAQFNYNGGAGAYAFAQNGQVTLVATNVTLSGNEVDVSAGVAQGANTNGGAGVFLFGKDVSAELLEVQCSLNVVNASFDSVPSPLSPTVRAFFLRSSILSICLFGPHVCSSVWASVSEYTIIRGSLFVVCVLSVVGQQQRRRLRFHQQPCQC